MTVLFFFFVGYVVTAVCTRFTLKWVKHEIQLQDFFQSLLHQIVITKGVGLKNDKRVDEAEVTIA